MSKPMNHDRRVKALLTAKVGKGSDPIAKAMIVQKRGGHHGDARKEASRRACRGGASWG
jgi:hypothetical protein